MGVVKIDNIKILVLANECFSDGNSNGRTLKNILGVMDKSCLSQFFIHGSPDFDFCENYYRVSDLDALNAFLGLRKGKSYRVKKPNEVTDNEVKLNSTGIKLKSVTRSCFTSIIRNIVWSSKRWQTKEFDDFITDFNPDILLLQAGDTPFMYDLASSLSKKYSLPLIVYNSEGYVLKKKIYSGIKFYNIFHPIFKRILINSYKRCYKNVSYSIYSTISLREAYDKYNNESGKSTTLYTVSYLPKLEDKSGNGRFNLLYCGNLGVGRLEAILDASAALIKANVDVVISVYGPCTEDEAKQLKSCPNVEYGGKVSYDTVVELMKSADMLFHLEKSDRVQNLYHAFSTKIADSLASGRPFLVYADGEYPFVKYLKSNDCCHVACNENEFIATVKRCIADKEFKNKYCENALLTAEKNHSSKNNDIKVKDIINYVFSQTEQQK